MCLTIGLYLAFSCISGALLQIGILSISHAHTLLGLCIFLLRCSSEECRGRSSATLPAEGKWLIMKIFNLAPFAEKIMFFDSLQMQIEKLR